MRNPFILALVALVVLAAWLFIARQPAVTAIPGGETNTPAQTSEAASGTVEIINRSFSPSVVRVKAGQTVTWTNQDAVEHSIISDSFTSSELLSKGESYSLAFSQPGTFSYICGPHPDMQGQVVVE